MKKITRRKFVKTSVALSGAALIGSQFPGILRANAPIGLPDVVTISGSEPMDQIPKLLEPLGGFQKFVKTGDRVGILVNSPWINPGTYTSPDVALSIAKLCKDAGAKEIICFKPVRENYWEESRYFEDLGSLTSDIIYGDERIEIEIPKGVELKKAEIFKIFMEADVYISIPVAKHHSGTLFSGNLKGLMGISSRTTNRYMHSPDGEYTYSKQEYLSQCIADLNLIRQPDLCIVDAIECVLENGPRGPGNTVKPNLLLAGIDPVALDTYAANLIGFDLNSIPTMTMASALGLGKSDLAGLNVMQL
jgi:uncharacterized protein (DUF362 family)